MDEFFDDEFDEEEMVKPKKLGKKNPRGPYKMEIKFNGVEYEITIENVSHTKFRVCAVAKNEEDALDEDFTERNLKVLEKYLNDEGFYVAAKKWNLYYK